MSIKEYRRKRDFKVTMEPAGHKKIARAQFLYVIQKHVARRLHYDFRLEMGGVLKSWAVPKGPSNNPNIKRLAVHVEDHPINYASFEGEIPAGEYGAGTVEIWDRGHWKPQTASFKKDYQEGHLNFELKGGKLKGLWKLIRLKDSPKDWLLIKMKEKSVSEEHSVLINKISQPTSISPELATLVDQVPRGENWLHEMKFDGYRCIAIIKNKKIKLMTRNKKDWTKKLPSVVAGIKSLDLGDAILDGEIVVLDESERSDFQLLQNSLQDDEKQNFIYYVFDIIYYDGYDLSTVPLIERKKLLRQLLPSNAKDIQSVRYAEHIIGDGDKLFKEYCQKSFEGIVSKKISSLYQQKRTTDWLKIKCIKRQEFVVGGFTDPKGNRKYFGSLLIGFYTENKALQYCGHVGTGFTEESLKSLSEILNEYKTSYSPFEKTNLIDVTQVHWVKPKMVIEVAFTEWTKDKLLRHPSFKGFRTDKNPLEVRLESYKNFGDIL